MTATRTVAITTSNFDLDNPLVGELDRRGWAVVRNPHGRRMAEDEVTALLAEHHAEAMIAGVEPLNEQVFAANPQLKYISRCGIGLDSIDMDAATARGIWVGNTPDAPSAAVAELAVGLMLALTRRIVESDQSVRRGEWRQLMGTSLGERVVGIIGLGRIGTRVADLVANFGARVAYYDPLVSEPFLTRYPNLLDLARNVDLLTIHVPLGDKTRYIVDAEVLDALPDHAFVVNTSRGGLLDEAALLRALEERRIAGAALDVFEREPYTGPLVGRPDVVITAHMGSYSRQTRVAMETDALANLLGALEA